MPTRMRITHGRPALGAAGREDFVLDGLNFARHPMGSSGSGAACHNRNMTRREWVFLTLVGSACRRTAAPGPELFPETAAGSWRRTSLRDAPVADSPDPVPRTAVANLRIADYEGPGKLQARAYELDSPAVGLELAQRWRPSADTVFFNRGPYFIVVKWQSADRKALKAFVEELEKRIGR